MKPSDDFIMFATKLASQVLDNEELNQRAIKYAEKSMYEWGIPIPPVDERDDCTLYWILIHDYITAVFTHMCTYQTQGMNL